MEPLMTMVSLKLKGMLRKERRGAETLEVILLIAVAVVIVGAIISAFVGGKEGKGGLLNDIVGKIKEVLGIGQ
jgi:predicted membrane-bound mannosyltransferase